MTRKPYRQYPPPLPTPLALALVGVLLLLVALVTWIAPARAREPAPTFQGKGVRWWAAHAVQARKDANARAVTVRRLRGMIRHDPSVQESIRLATIVYPAFTERRAWEIIKHESWMTADPLHAYNSTSVRGCHARWLYQFLDCTFRSTPFARAGLDPASPYVQSLAAGWMHANRRGCEWDIGPEC